MNNKNKIFKEILDYVKVIVIAIVIATLISTQVFTFSQVQQKSMEQTLIENDAILIEKISLLFHEPKIGEIVVLLEGVEVNNSFFGKIERLYVDLYNKFRKVEFENRLVKRVIGLPGDMIDIKEGKVFVNDVALVEPYVTSETDAKGMEVPFTVQPGQVFVLGDNRAVSMDSREFGCVDLKQIEGIAVFRIYPLNKIGVLE
ncbi:MAG: signal peptidase I [Firmicutes bacterium HGW-Firmicutes-1]|jgi:signal peptidase I|nr:MAG: signal peptidase I [Firmicutes bacterium HGW-Firmicutes-1]